MFVNISPAVYNLGETICSLNFASRCRNTELGQAKKQTDDRSASSASLKPSGGSTDALATATPLTARKTSSLLAGGGASSLKK